MNGSLPIRIWILVALVLLASIMACSSKDAVSQLLEDLEEAAEAIVTGFLHERKAINDAPH